VELVIGLVKRREERCWRGRWKWFGKSYNEGRWLYRMEKDLK
jgi:hypothetical protein